MPLCSRLPSSLECRYRRSSEDDKRDLSAVGGDELAHVSSYMYM